MKSTACSFAEACIQLNYTERNKHRIASMEQ